MTSCWRRALLVPARAVHRGTGTLVSVLLVSLALEPSDRVGKVPPPIEDPDAHGVGFLRHAYILATLGTSMAIAGAIGVSITVASGLSCARSPGCRDEGGPAIGYLVTAPFLLLGVSMIAFAIPLLIKGLRERFDPVTEISIN